MKDNMNVSTSFSFPEEFKNRLDALSSEAGKTRTQYVIDAIELASKTGNAMPPSIATTLEILNREINSLGTAFRELLEEHSRMAGELRTTRVLCAEILKNQQEKTPD